MAIIRCINCNKEISDIANSCPYCNYPISQKTIVEERFQCSPTIKYAKDTHYKPGIILGVLSLLVALVCLIVLIFLFIDIINATISHNYSAVLSYLKPLKYTGLIGIALSLVNMSKPDKETTVGLVLSVIGFSSTLVLLFIISVII